MDPLTALSLAGNIIQFVDFGNKLLCKAGELYKSTKGSLKVNDELELVSTDLRALVRKLQAFCPSPPEEGGEDPWREFRKICNEAELVAKELVGRLETLKVDGDSKHPKWHSLQLAVKNLWGEKEVASLMKRLTSLREALETRILFSIRSAEWMTGLVDRCANFDRENLDTQAIRTSARFDSLDQQTQLILTTMLEHSSTSSEIPQQIREDMSTLTIAVTKLLSRLGFSNTDDHVRDRERILEKFCKRENIPDGKDQQLIVGMEMFEVPDIIERHLRASVQNEIIRSLSYAEMAYRYEDIVEAHPETFQWVFHDSHEKQRSGSDLSDWLQTGDGVYWVNGKAGSGKSTFMKYLFDTEHLREYLELWAGDTPLCIATFFFWNSGTKLQMSQIGFLRALLYQVLSKFPDLVPVVLPKVWAAAYSEATRFKSMIPTPIWQLRQLMDAFRALGEQTSIPVKTYFLIDGLDEFNGDHDNMGILFKDITKSSRIKACLSSRPWIVFEDLFNDCPKLYLQNLTYQDIEKYVNDRLNRSEQYRKLAARDTEEALALGKEIVEKADGVFLWVKLVVDSLLSGIRNRDEISDLWERLRLLPKDLEPLYHRFMGLVEPIYRTWVSEVFQILRANRALGYGSPDEPYVRRAPRPGVLPLTLSTLFFAMCKDVDFSSVKSLTQRRHNARCEDTKVQLTARCGGFLEVLNLTGKSFTGPDSRIQYFHRTAKDFIESDSYWPQLVLETRTPNFDANISMMRSCLLSIEFGIAQKSFEDTRAIMAVADDVRIYASHTIPHGEILKSRIALLHHLSVVMGKCDGQEETSYTQSIIGLVPGSRWVSAIYKYAIG